jgi:very-short-patch-repair endonuclease
VVTRAQLLRIGLGYRAIDDRIARGLLHPIHRGVYAVGHRLRTPEATWMAAVLACPGAVLSHRSAAALWGIRDTTRAITEITLPRLCRRPRIQAHRAVLPPDETTTERGIPVTNPARTLLDLAAVLTPQQLAHALNEAEVRRLASPLPLDALVARHPGRRGTTALKRALAKQREIGETITRSEFEERFRAFVDDHALPHPRMNAALGPYTPDAVRPDARLVVELDSYGIHTTRQAFESDRERDRTLQLMGYRVVRITWRQLSTQPRTIAEQLRTLLTAGPRPR